MFNSELSNAYNKLDIAVKALKEIAQGDLLEGETHPLAKMAQQAIDKIFVNGDISNPDTYM